MSIKYRFRRSDLDQPWSLPREYMDHAARVREAVKKMGPGKDFQVRKWSGEHKGTWGETMNRRTAIKQYLTLIKESHVGAYFSLRSGDKVIVSRTIENEIKVLDTDGNDRVDRAFTEILTHWPNAENWGICACRDVAGTSSWSQHAYCNAIDINSSSDSMYQIAGYLLQNANDLSVHTIIYHRQVWSRETPYWHYYDGVNPHYDHVHVDFDPQGAGTPPC